MTWVRIDDGMMEHPKMLEIGPEAACIHLWALCYSSRHLTDGFISRRALSNCDWLAVRWRQRTRSVDQASTVRRLIVNGLWHPEANGFRINDFLDYNPSKAEVEEKRRQTADRVKRWRLNKLGGGNAVTNASGNSVGNDPPSPGVTKVTSVTRYTCPRCGIEKATVQQLADHLANVHDEVPA